MPSRTLLLYRSCVFPIFAGVIGLGTISTSSYAFADPRPNPNDPGGLETSYDYDTAGYQHEVTDNAGMVTRTEYDALGRPTAVIENYVDGSPETGDADEDRTTRYAYNAAGQIVEQTADLNDFTSGGDQATHYIYSDELSSPTSGGPVPSFGQLRAVVYPDALEDGETRAGVISKLNSATSGDFVESTYYADGAMRARTDQRGVKLTYHYNDDGTRKAQVASNFDADTDDSVQSMTYTYDNLQRLLAVSSHSSAQTAPTATDVVNQVTHEYTGMGQLAKQRQDLDSVVDSTAPGSIPTQDVIYAYDTSASGNAFTKALRQTSVTYPNGRKLHTLYNATPGNSGSGTWGAPGIDDALSRPNGLANDNGSGSAGDTLVAYAHSGAGTTVIKDLPRILTRLDHTYEAPGEAAPNDYLPGVDRFGRLERLRWDRIDSATGDPLTGAHGTPTGPLFDLRYAYDAASNRLHTERRVYGAYSEKYEHDELHRLTSYHSGIIKDDLSAIDYWTRKQQVWNLDALGNQLETDYFEATDYIKHTTNDANELEEIYAQAGYDRKQTTESFSSDTSSRWESIGTDTFNVSGGYLNINSVAADTIDGNTETETRATVLRKVATGPAGAQYSLKFPSGITSGKAGFVFGYQSANDYWVQVFDLGTNEVYWQHIVNGDAGVKHNAKTRTINAGSTHTGYCVTTESSTSAYGHPFNSLIFSEGNAPTGKIGFFSTVAGVKFNYLNLYNRDWNLAHAGRWTGGAIGKLDAANDNLHFYNQAHGNAPFTLDGVRLDNYQATFSLKRGTAHSGVYLRFDDRGREGASQLTLRHTNTNVKVAANNNGDVPSTTTNNNLPTTTDADTLWFRVEAQAYGPNAGTVTVYANKSTTEPTSWNKVYESSDFDLSGGTFSFSRFYSGHARLDDLTVKADRNHDGTFEVTEHEDDFTADTNGFVEQSPEHDAAGNLTYDGTFAYAYDAWNRLTTVTKAYRQPDGTPGSGAIQLGSVVNAVEYDGLGRRIVKRVQNSADFDTTEHHYYNGNQLIEIRNGSDLVVKQHVWGLDYIDELIEVSINQDPTDTSEDVCERPFYAVHNAQYNVLGLVQPRTNSSFTPIGQRLAERYEYTPYGERQVYSHGWLLADLNGDGEVSAADYTIIADNFGSSSDPDHPADLNGNGSVDAADFSVYNDAFGDNVPQGDSLVLTPSAGTYRSTHTYGGGAGIPLNTIGHQGLSHDEETGLVYNRARYLHSQLERFTQRDPLGYVDGMSMYVYYAGLRGGVDPTGKLLIAFDGTNNVPTDNTNVRAFWDNYTGAKGYYSGVGTQGFKAGRFIEGLFGSAFGYGIEDRIEHAQALICAYLAIHPGEPIDIIGFSRGAATARAFANHITDNGTLANNSSTIRFIGVWDTVPSVGLALDDGGYKLGIPNGFTGVAHHAMALDERRSQFEIRRYSGANEVWFRGVHSDVGGGYALSKRGLANISLKWMTNRAKEAQVPVTSTYSTNFTEVSDNNTIIHKSRKGKWLWLPPYGPSPRAVKSGDQVHITAIMPFVWGSEQPYEEEVSIGKTKLGLNNWVFNELFGDKNVIKNTDDYEYLDD